MNLHLFKHYQRLIFRQLWRNKLFTFINLIGLGTGLAVTFFISLFILNELSYENIHHKANRIFRVTMDIEDANYKMHWARVNRNWINYLEEDFSEIKHLIRFQDYYPRNIKVGENSYKIPYAYTVDGEVFEVFSFQLLRGNPKTALKQPHSVVLTEAIAQRLFGDKDPMNQEVVMPSVYGAEKQTYKVTGIMKDLPSNTHLPVNLLTSFTSAQDRQGWAYTYILLNNKKDAATLTQKMSSFITKRGGEEEANSIKLPLQNLQSIHLNSDLAREIIPNEKMSRLYLFAGVGFFIFIMSAINFINLNLAQSLKRLREVGLRKLLGSSPQHVWGYFLIQANTITLLATAFGGFLLIAFLPFFQEFTPIAISPWMIIPLAILLALCTGFVAGIFPVFLFANTQLVEALKGKTQLKNQRAGWGIKNFLVGFQLILCIVLISSALITQSQFSYLVNKNLGLEKEQVLAITGIPDPVKLKYDFLKEQIAQLASVEGVSASMEVPSKEIKDMGAVYAEGMPQDEDQAPMMDVQVVDPDFLDLMGLDLIAGRNFREPNLPKLEEVFKGDAYKYLQESPREYILNETALKMVGWKDPEEALGKSFSWSISGIQLEKGPVVGVVKDFHQESLRNRIKPIVMLVEPMWLNNILIKIQGQQVSSTLASIQTFWKTHFPDYALEYAFVDDLYNQLYETEQKQLQLIYVFSALAILIAFLGIFGLLSYTLKSREKEIAVRKVLGANLSSLTVLLSKRFVMIALIGMTIAVPFCWWGMQEWLQNFEYRVAIQPFHFLSAILLIFIVLLTTISLQLRRVAQQNPAELLRTE